MKYLRTNIEDEYGIAELQDKILEVMIYIDQFCNQHGVDYCLMAGSALGARRHNGFIPWDDDMDIYMSEGDYDKFKKSFNLHGDKEKFYLQEWGAISKNGKHYITMAKIRMNGTYIEEELYRTWKIHKGVFVDIFIIHNCPNSKLLQIKQYLWGEAVVLKGLSSRNYKPKGGKDKFLLAIGRVLPLNWIKYHGLKNNFKYQNQQTGYVSGFIDTRNFSRAVFPREIIFPTKYADFETIRLKVPCDNDAYLRIQFGDDYMSLPTMEKRPIHKHGVEWALKPQADTQNFSDESRLI